MKHVAYQDWTYDKFGYAFTASSRCVEKGKLFIDLYYEGSGVKPKLSIRIETHSRGLIGNIRYHNYLHKYFKESSCDKAVKWSLGNYGMSGVREIIEKLPYELLTNKEFIKSLIGDNNHFSKEFKIDIAQEIVYRRDQYKEKQKREKYEKAQVDDKYNNYKEYLLGEDACKVQQ